MQEKAVLDRIVDVKYVVLLVGDEKTEHILPSNQIPYGVKMGTPLLVEMKDGQVTSVKKSDND